MTILAPEVAFDPVVRQLITRPHYSSSRAAFMVKWNEDIGGITQVFRLVEFYSSTLSISGYLDLSCTGTISIKPTIFTRKSTKHRKAKPRENCQAPI